MSGTGAKHLSNRSETTNASIAHPRIAAAARWLQIHACARSSCRHTRTHSRRNLSRTSHHRTRASSKLFPPSRQLQLRRSPVNEKANDDQISALVWQLRDAARTHSFDAIHLPQKQVDADGKTVWFHIYRGTKCAPEKYAPGNPPCGASYHAAADYTFDTHSTPPWDKGVILHAAPNGDADPHPTLLWDPDAPYTPATK